MLDGSRGGKREALIAAAAALGTRRADLVRAALARAAREERGEEVEEMILQSHLFIGFPDALGALALWREVSGSPAPLRAAAEGESLWEERGARVCATVYEKNYERLRANVAALHPDFDRWMVVGGYGRVIGRPGLDLATRELCIAALLAVWDAPRQLHSHLRGALNAGAAAAQVERAVEIACSLLDPERAERVRSLWSEVRSRSAEPRTSQR
ncbi:MAG TPA: carboxymuconolactone decarboxylase family protein [Longimicrobiaceae bacterium]|nr:carboxymuconolactone decarboxylase family protein [Longimicrobiaceae bacterium]